MDIQIYKTMLDENRHNILVKESSVPCKAYSDADSFDSTEKVFHLMHDVFSLHRMAEEYMYMLALDCKLHLLGVFEVSHGSASMAMANPREIYIRALLCGAQCIILVHNHPSGDPSPSKEDFAVTERIKKSGKLLDIPLLDHMVIGGDTYYDFREENKL